MDQITKVFIIQSLKTTDKLKSGKALESKLLPTITTEFKDFETDEEVFAYLDNLKIELKNNPGLYIIHFDCHGNKDGIGIYDRSDYLYFISWEDLRNKLRDIYLASEQKPIVSFSSCEGFNVAKLVAHFKPCPYYLVTGSFKKIIYQESIDGYFHFYNNINVEKEFTENVREVRTKYPALNFVAFTAEQLFYLGWDSYLKSELTPDRIKERKEKIKTEIIKTLGSISKEQENILSNQFTKHGSDDQYNRYRDIFFT